MRDGNEMINALRQCVDAFSILMGNRPPVPDPKNPPGFDTVMFAAWHSLVNARAVLDAVEQERGDSYDDIWNALWRITTAITVLPTYEVKREGGIKEVTDDVVDAILAAAEQLKEQE